MVVVAVPILSVAIVAVVVAVIEAKKKIQQQGMMVRSFCRSMSRMVEKYYSRWHGANARQ